MAISRLCEDHKQRVMKDPINRPVKKHEAVRATKSYGFEPSSVSRPIGDDRAGDTTGEPAANLGDDDDGSMLRESV